MLTRCNLGHRGCTTSEQSKSGALALSSVFVSFWILSASDRSCAMKVHHLAALTLVSW
jgi:hypothetical protein